LLEGLAHVAPGWRSRDGAGNGRDFWALRDVSLAIEPGETVGVIGRNGSGKPTLLQIIAGTLTPTTGDVTVRGRLAALLELGAGFTPELTGIENVRMNAGVLGLSPKEIDDRLDRILAFADIGGHADQPVRTYSSGMFVRLAFAVAIHVDPDVLIIDEALAVGDIAFQARCMARIRRFQDEGKALLFVSHDVATVRALCHRCLYLEHGAVLALGPAPTVVDQYIRDLHVEQGSTPGVTATATPVVVAAHAGSGSLRQRFAAFDAARATDGHGTGDARIRLVELVDRTGRPVSIAEFDTVVRVRIWVECVRACAVSVNYKVRNRQLIAVTGADFLIASHELLVMTPGSFHLVEYETRLSLMDGDYSLRVSITEPIDRHARSVFLDVVELTTPFSILPATRGRIYTQVYLPHTLTVSACNPDIP
jgi:lipopolysaccharide transport system ATP-binding protein